MMSVAVFDCGLKTPEARTYSIIKFQYEPIVVPQIGSCGFSSPESAMGTNGGSTVRLVALSIASRRILRYSAAVCASFCDCAVSPISANTTDMSRRARHEFALELSE